MAALSLPHLPSNLEHIRKYLEIATDYEATDLSVSYWCNNDSFDCI